WLSIEVMNQDPQTIVVVPSMTLDTLEGSAISMQPYEERYLFLLLLLRQPHARMIYVTSQPILPSVIDYYLDLLPGVIPSHARPRLFTVPVLDGSGKPLSVKLLERDLAVRLGIPMYGADPRHFPLGTKSGCRRLFDEEGVRYPLGVENLSTIDDAIDAIVDVRARKPEVAQVLVKL